MATNGAALSEERAGNTFGVELYVPWDAPEAVVDISSKSVVPLRNIPDVIGQAGRREGAAESRVLQGRDIRSVRVLVPDCRGVAIVDMGDVPESSISIPEFRQWPPAVISQMGWRQQVLEGMRAAAKQHFHQSLPSSCIYCGIWIKCDMYRNVARFHFDLAQLWRCPVSWCTVWKGTPQDCMDHIRRAHDVPWEIKLASLVQYLPLWMVTRQVWSDSLTAQHSGISTDVLLFSDIHLSLVHHYRIHKRGLPHITFRRKYLSQLHALLPLQVFQPADGVVSPDSFSSGSLRPAESSEVVDKSPRTTRRAYRRRRPVRVMEPPIENIPVLTIQDPLAAAGAVVLDCRPPLLPVSMDISGVDLSVGRLPHERESSFSGGGGGAGLD